MANIMPSIGTEEDQHIQVVDKHVKSLDSEARVYYSTLFMETILTNSLPGA